VSLSGNLTLVAGGTLTQSSTIFAIGGAANLSATGAMTLTNATNDFGIGLTLAGAGGALDGTVNALSGAAAATAVPSPIAVASSGFTFGGATLTPPTPPTTVTSTTPVTTEAIAQLITQLLTATTTTTSSSSSSATANDTPGAQTSPAAVQAALTALLSESATPGGGTGQTGDGANLGGTGANTQPGGQGQTATPAPAGTFPAGTTITINTVGGVVASVTVTPPVGGGPPQIILPGLLNLTPPVVPSATQSGTPGLTGAFMQNGNFR